MSAVRLCLTVLMLVLLTSELVAENWPCWRGPRGDGSSTETSVHGFCSSPVLYERLVILNGDHDGDAWVAGLEKSTGKTVWKVPREHKTRSYCTPIIRRIAGKDQLVMSGSKQIVSLDPQTGGTVWRIEGPTEQFVASMVYDGSCFYMAAGFPTHHVMSIRPDGSGNVTDTHVTWHSTEAKCYVPSPAVSQGQVVFARRKAFVCDWQITQR